MRNEPIEFGAMGLAQRAKQDRLARLAKRVARVPQAHADYPPPDALDEAFAGFAKTGSRATRVDGPDVVPSAPVECADTWSKTSNWEPFQRELVADLSAQLNSLDQHRARLAELLRNIDPRTPE